MLNREWTYMGLYRLNTTLSMFKLVQVVVKHIRVFLMDNGPPFDKLDIAGSILHQMP